MVAPRRALRTPSSGDEKSFSFHHPPESLALSKRQSGPTPAQRAPARCRRCLFDGLIPARSETLASRIYKLIRLRRRSRSTALALAVARRGSMLLPRLKRSRPKSQSRYPTPYAEVLIQDKQHGAAPDGLTTLLHTTLRLAPLRAKTFTRLSKPPPLEPNSSLNLPL